MLGPTRVISGPEMGIERTKCKAKQETSADPASERKRLSLKGGERDDRCGGQGKREFGIGMNMKIYVERSIRPLS